MGLCIQMGLRELGLGTQSEPALTSHLELCKLPFLQRFSQFLLQICGRSQHSVIMVREREEERVVEEVEAVDAKAEIEDSCKPRCVKQLISYEACVKRIESDEQGHKHCTGQYFDYWGCIDQCAAPKVFRKLA